MPLSSDLSARTTVASRGSVVRAACLLALGAAAGVVQGQPFLSDITRWTDQDALSPRPTGAVLFVGSSSIRRWERLTIDFEDYEVIQRGFGGCQLEHVNFWFEEIVAAYEPRAIVMWAGTNDVSSGETAAEVAADFQTFVATLKAELPDTDLFYLGITPTPGNQGTTAARDLANQLIEDQTLLDPRLHFIDLPSVFYALDPFTSPEFTALYVDPTHLNRDGYDLWTSVIRPRVESVVAPNKPAFSNPLAMTVGERMLFDFGPSNPEDGDPTTSPDIRGNHWNNWHPAEGNVRINPGEHIAGLVTTAGRDTGAELVITADYLTYGKVNGGLLSPDPALLGDLAVSTATQDYFYSTGDLEVGGGEDDTGGGFRLSGLDPALVYEFGFFGSRQLGSQDRVTEFRVIGQTDARVLQHTTGRDIGAGGYDGNNDNVSIVTGVRPNRFGEVFVDMTVITSEFAYLNAMSVEAVPLGVSGAPSDMIVEAGGTLTFSVGLEVSQGIEAEVRWHKDGEPLFDEGRVRGATTGTLVITGAGAADAGEYTLVASGGGRTSVSAAAISAVRRSALGSLDADNNGSLDFFDVITNVGGVEGSQ